MDSRIPNPFRIARDPGRVRQWQGLNPGGVRVLYDFSYGPDPRNKLDLYLPDRPDFPAAVFVHGGYWSRGDKAMYADVGSFLARHGIGAAVVNYRLSPAVRHPAHVQDVAAAFAWVRRHVASFGGDPTRTSVFGHSAGAHLVSLLATDTAYLRSWDLSPRDVRGVVSVSGVYRIGLNVTLYGVGHVFRGADRAAASPWSHARRGCPPFLLLYGQRDLWTLAGQARRMHARLVANRTWSHLVRVPGQTHKRILRTAVVPGAPHGRQIVNFLLNC